MITVFWIGSGAINMTTMMAFQEVSDECVAVRDNINIEKTRTGQLNIYTQSETNVVTNTYCIIVFKKFQSFPES